MIWVLLLLTAEDPLAPLPEPNIAAERVIKRGDALTLRVASGSLTISTAAKALSDGRAGERVRVTVPATRRTLDAIVEGPGVARLPSL